MHGQLFEMLSLKDMEVLTSCSSAIKTKNLDKNVPSFYLEMLDCLELRPNRQDKLQKRPYFMEQPGHNY